MGHDVNSIIKAKETENWMKIEKRGELTNASKTVELQIRNNKGKFQEAYSALNELLFSKGGEKHVAHAVTTAMMRLETCKLEVENAQNEYAKLCIQCDKEVPETVYEWSLEAERMNNEIINKAKIFCSKHNQTQVGVKEDSEKGKGAQLKKMKFDTFKGDIRKYPCFKREFQKHIRPHYSLEKEAFVLKSYLDSEIKEDVLAAGDDAEEIWKRLDKKYGDEGKLVDSFMKDVKQIKECDDSSPEGIIKMILVIERAYRDLTCLAMEQEISNAPIVSLIEQKLPKCIEDDWLAVTGEIGLQSVETNFRNSSRYC